jgi:hypothetical protein
VHPSSSYLDDFSPMNSSPQTLLTLLLHCCLHDAEAYGHGGLALALLSELQKRKI